MSQLINFDDRTLNFSSNYFSFSLIKPNPNQTTKYPLLINKIILYIKAAKYSLLALQIYVDFSFHISISVANPSLKENNPSYLGDSNTMELIFP